MRLPWQKKPTARVFTVPLRVGGDGPSIEGFEEFVKDLAADMGARGTLPRASPSPAEQIAAMQAMRADYGLYGRFAPGDVVTPRKDCPLHGSGKPHIVLEVGPAVMAMPTDADAHDSNWGERLDMRVMHIGPNGHIHAHWVESYHFEPYAAAE